MIETEEDRQSLLEIFGEDLQFTDNSKIRGVFKAQPLLLGEDATITTYLPTFVVSTLDWNNRGKGTVITRDNNEQYKVVRTVDDKTGMTLLEVKLQ